MSTVLRPYQGEVVGSYPAQLAVIRDKHGDPVSIHRTYLSNDGFKADLPHGEKAKRWLPITSNVEKDGCSIQLCKPGKVLCLAEGLETCYSIMAATGLPVWSTIATYFMSSFNLDQIKDTVKFLVIYADKDLTFSGENAAKELYERALAAGIKCQILLPPYPVPEGKKGIDWNDVLIKYGPDAIPYPDINRAAKAV